MLPHTEPDCTLTTGETRSIEESPTLALPEAGADAQ